MGMGLGLGLCCHQSKRRGRLLVRLDGPQPATGWIRCFLEDVSARSQELQLGSLDLKRAWRGLRIHTVSNCRICGGTLSSRWKLTNGAIFGHSGLLLCRGGTVMIGRLTAAFLWMGRVGTPFGGVVCGRASKGVANGLEPAGCHRVDRRVTQTRSRQCPTVSNAGCEEAKEAQAARDGGRC